MVVLRLVDPGAGSHGRTRQTGGSSAAVFEHRRRPVQPAHPGLDLCSGAMGPIRPADGAQRMATPDETAWNDRILDDIQEHAGQITQRRLAGANLLLMTSIAPAQASRGPRRSATAATATGTWSSARTAANP